MDINRTMKHKPRAVRKLLDSYSSEETKENELKSCSGDGFRWPAPPRPPLPWCPPPFGSLSDTSEDSQPDIRGGIITPRKNCYQHHHQLSKIKIGQPGVGARGYQSDGSPARMLPPIGVFWDIENCQIPRGKSAVAVAQTIRNKFFDGYREAEFVVVCDVRKENCQVIQELNDAQVNLIHVGATSKNAADEKLRHSMRRFADIHGFPAAIVLVSGDINFAPDLCDLRHRKKIHIILVHNEMCSESLILCANEHYVFSSLVETLPHRNNKTGNQSVEVVVRNLPAGYDEKKVRRKLKCLSENCGGRVADVSNSTATIRFHSVDFAKRAQKRMDGEVVFGNQISVGFPQRVGGARMDSLSSVHSNGQSFGDGDERTAGATSCPTNSNAKSFPLIVPTGGSRPLFDWKSGSTIYEAQQQKQHTGVSRAWPQPNNQENYTSVPNQLQVDSSWLWPCQQNNGSFQQVRDRTVLGTRNETNSIANPSATWNWSGLPSSYTGGITSAGWATNESAGSGLGAVRQQANVGKFPAERVNAPEPDSTFETLPSLGTCLGDTSEAFVKRPRAATISAASKVPPPLIKYSRHSLDSFLYNPSGRNCGGASGVLVGRKCRTPSPYMMATPSSTPQVNKQHLTILSRKPHQRLLDYSDNEKYFNPISSSSSSNGSSTHPVELHISNLDQGIKPTMMKKILMSIFGEHVMVLHVSVYMQSDGHFAATLKVPTLQDAQYAISRLHRRKIGMRRISISYAHTNQLQHDSQHLRWQIVSLLQEVPSYKLPLFKFMELFESRYTGTISVSDLGKLKDVCVIKTENNCRVVTLTADHRNTPSPNLAPHQEVEVYCSTHYKGIQSMDKGWAEQEALPLPNISEPLGQFSDNTHRLLASHNNTLPLSSFCDCYEAECGSLNITEAGVPLEHLIACVPRVEIAVVSGGIKYVRPAPPQKTYATDDPMADISKSVSPSLYHQLMQFGRELVDLLKTQPRCQLMFNRFIPAYHHHFGKQCRVADFGFTKLIDLLDTLPNMIHVIGNGKKRIITLSFSAQVRRFTADLLRVLKSQPFKRLELSELGDLFERTLGRPFEPMDYGLCRVEDLVAQLTESSLVVTKSPADGSITSISVSPHVQTTEEMELTKVFAREVIELLSHASQCCILFNKFIPAYHHHFGHQCRVADFGFTKLIELFEAIPDVVKIEKNAEGEREVTLMPRLKLEVLNEQVCKLASARYPPGLPLKSLPAAFLWQYGYTLRPENYQAADMDELMTKITTVKVENLDCGPTLIPIDEAQIHQLSSQIRLLLMNSADGSAPLAKLQASFPKCYRHHLTQERLANYMADIVEIEERNGKKVVTLNRLNLFTRNLYRLLLKQSGCRLPVKLLETAYQWEYSERVKPEDFGKQSVGALLASITHTVTLRGKGSRRMVALNRDMVNGQSVNFPSVDQSSEESTCVDGVFSLGDYVNGSMKKSAESLWTSGCHLEGYDNQVPMVMLPEMSLPPANIMEKTALISPCKTLIGATGSAEGTNGDGAADRSGGGGSTELWDMPPAWGKATKTSPPLGIVNICPPHPSQLPLPQMYLVSPKQQEVKKLQKSESLSRLNGTSSGEDSKKTEDWPAGRSGECQSSPGRGTGATTPPMPADATPPFPLMLLDSANRRKLRLAAHFQTPMDL